MAPASSGYDRQTAPSSRYREVAVVRSPPMQVASPGHTRRYLSPGMRHRSPVYRPPSPPSSTFREVAYVHRGSPSRRDTPDMRYSVPFSARKALGGTLQSSPEQLDSARSSERSVFIPADATPMNVGRRPPSRTTLAQQRAPDPLVNALQGQSKGPRRPPSPTLLSQQSASDPLVNRCVPSEPEKATLSLSPSPLHVLCSNARHAKRAGRASFDVLLKHSRRIEEWGYGVSYRILIDVMLLACVPLFLFSRIVRQRFSSSLQPLLFRSSESGHGPLSARSAGNISVGEPRLYGSAVSHDSSHGLHFSQTSSSRVLSRQAPKADDAPWYAERLPADLEHEIRMLEAKTSIDSYPRDAVQRHLNATEHYQGRPQYLGRPTEGPRRGDALATGKALKMANFDMSWEERKEHTLSKPFQKNMPPKVQKSGMYSGWPMEDDRPVVTLEEKPGTVRAFGKDGKVVASTITVWVLDMVGRKHPIVTTTDDDIIGLRYEHIYIHEYLNVLRMFRCVLCTVRNVLERSEKRCSWRTIHQSFILTVPAPFNNVAMTKTGRYKIMKLPWIKEIEGTWKIHGGHEIILQRKAIDKWTGTEVTLTLEVCKRSKMYTCISFLSVRASFRCDEPCIKAAC